MQLRPPCRSIHASRRGTRRRILAIGPDRRGALRQIDRVARAGIARGLLLGLVVVSAVCSGTVAAQQTASPPPGPLARSGSAQSGSVIAFKGVKEAAAVRSIFDWIARSDDNQGLPFIIIDKVNAEVFVFDGSGVLRGSTPALLGLGRGDDSAPGIGQRKLASIPPDERTTPAGRFVATLGHDFDQDILWVDYDAALSLHRVIVGNPADRRQARLASATPLDNRISYGCINVPAQFYDRVVAPRFHGTVGIVYILPETRAIEAVFDIRGNPSAAVSGP